MPYANNSELPLSVQNHLPAHAQDIYRKAFNHAWQEYGDPSMRRSGDTLEEVAHRVAWGVVKKEYRKEGAEWVEHIHS